METYLRRLYLQNKTEEESKTYPVWDYRSRRSSLSTSLSCGDGSVLSSTGSSRSEVEMSESGSSVSSGSGSDMDVAALRDPARLTFELLVDPHEVYPLLDIYEPLIGWIDSDLRLFHASERRAGSASVSTHAANSHVKNGVPRGILVNKHGNNNHRKSSTSSRTVIHNGDSDFSFGQNRTAIEESEGLPPFSVILFLYEEEISSGGRVDCVRRCLERAPWRLHHSEKASRRNLNLNPKSLDYFVISEDLPLWSVRQVHYGKEHIRIVVQTKEDTWTDMVEFYKLILGFEPDFFRDDFCLFTVHSQINFDIQFALKRDQSPSTSTRPSPLQSIRLRFKVADLGRLVPLFPNVCQPVSDSCWLTTDHDGNEVILDVTGYGVIGSTSSASDRTSSESCASTSSSDVSFDSHDSGNSQGSTCGVDSGEPVPRSTLDTFKCRKSQSEKTTANLCAGAETGKSQRRVTFCFDDVPPASSSPPTSPPRETSRLKSVLSPSSSTSSSPPETRFNLRFDTCPTAPLSKNNTREEQIGFYV